VPIGSFQAVAHPLADAFIATEGARQLVHKAAWFLDHEPDGARQLVPMAALAASEAATSATSTSLHVQGGLGFTLESDTHLYFRRAKLLQVMAGDPETLLSSIAVARYGPLGGSGR
jgi:alkylation response protein AidB-like acyl-CoA dehydrogenase